MMRNSSFLPRSTPAQMGVDPEALHTIYRAISEQKLGAHSLLFLRHGAVIAEGWWKPWRAELPHMLYSLSKSFTSTAIGFAIQEGLLQLDDRVVSFFPEKLPAPPCGNMEKLTIRHLLTMSTGHSVEPPFLGQALSGDCVAQFLRSYIDLEPGSYFCYNTAATYMLSALVTKCTGQTVRDYLVPRLFAPLGIETPRWESCPQGNSAGGVGLNLKTEDIAKFGQFLLQKGEWKGKQLLNAAWIEDATAFHVQNFGLKDWGQGYCYQFWRCRPEGVYRGDGAFGQYVVVLPKQDMVIAVTSGSNDMQAELDLCWEHLLPALSDEPLPENPTAQAALEKTLGNLCIPCVSGERTAPIASVVSGKRYLLSPNPLFSAIRFDFGETASVTFTRMNEAGEYTLPIGYEKWLESSTGISAEETDSSTSLVFEQAACSGGWEGSTYHLVMACNTTPYTNFFDVTFDEKGLVLRYHRDVTMFPVDFTAFGR